MFLDMLIHIAVVRANKQWFCYIHNDLIIVIVKLHFFRCVLYSKILQN